MFYLFVKPAFAVCPVCTIAVGAGLGLSRWLGIDDTVSGIWVGGLILSSALWFANWLKAKKPSIKNPAASSTILFYLITLLPLWKTGIIGHPYNMIWGMDKLIVGIILGSLGFLGAVGLDSYLRKFHPERKALFAWQKVIIPLVILIVTSGIMYFVSK